MKKTLLLAATLFSLAAGARAQTAPATDASGVLPIQRGAPAAPPPAAAAAAPARPAPDPAQQAARQSQRLTQALGLSPDQQARVQQILLAERQDLLAARQQAQASGTRRGVSRARKAERSQADEQLRAVLTAGQYARYQQLLIQRKQQAQQRRQQKPPTGLFD